MPDVVLVKKHFADKALRNRKRKWKLKHMEGFPHMETESCNEEFADFAVNNSIHSNIISRLLIYSIYLFIYVTMVDYFTYLFIYFIYMSTN